MWIYVSKKFALRVLQDTHLWPLRICFFLLFTLPMHLWHSVLTVLHICSGHLTFNFKFVAFLPKYLFGSIRFRISISSHSCFRNPIEANEPNLPASIRCPVPSSTFVDANFDAWPFYLAVLYQTPFDWVQQIAEYHWDSKLWFWIQSCVFWHKSCDWPMFCNACFLHLH